MKLQHSAPTATKGAFRPSAGSSSAGKSLPAPAATIYNSQAGSIVFACGTVFKVSSLPGLVAQNLPDSTLWLYMFMSAVDLLCLAAIFFFSKSGADGLLSPSSRAYRALCGLLSLYLTVKGFFYFVYTVIFLSVDLFARVDVYVVAIVLAIPVAYIGVKGFRAVARAAELLAPVLFFVIVINLAFLKTDLDFGRNLPVDALPTSRFFEEGLRYSLWLGDMFPLLFVRLKNKRLPHLAIGAGISYALVLTVAMLAVAMYGRALPFVYNMLIRIAGFNQLSLEIGRLEWAALFVVVVMAVLGLSLVMTGAGESCRRAVGTPVPSHLLFVAATVAGTVAIPTLHEAADFARSPAFGYSCFAAALFFAAAFAACAVYARRKTRPSRDAAQNPEASDSEPPSARVPCDADANCGE